MTISDKVTIGIIVGVMVFVALAIVFPRRPLTSREILARLKKEQEVRNKRTKYDWET